MKCQKHAVWQCWMHVLASSMMRALLVTSMRVVKPIHNNYVHISASWSVSSEIISRSWRKSLIHDHEFGLHASWALTPHSMLLCTLQEYVRRGYSFSQQKRTAPSPYQASIYNYVVSVPVVSISRSCSLPRFHDGQKIVLTFTNFPLISMR